MNLNKVFSDTQQDQLLDAGLLILRLAFGLTMLFGHGIGKWTRLFGEDPIKFADPFGFGPVTSLTLVIFAEVLCSALIFLGLFTRWAAIPLFIAMAVAVVMVHWNDPFARMEKALMYAVVYISLILMGPGRYSLDYLIFSKK